MDGCRVGVGRADITPVDPGPVCGWGPPGARKARPPADDAQRLFATALALEDANGERAVFVAVDLHSGGVVLWRAAASAAGLDPSRLVLCGTHTHAGPGQRYGGRYFRFATASPFGVGASTRRLSESVGVAVRQAVAASGPGGVGVGRAVVSAGGSNRAAAAWEQYGDEERAAFFETGPGHDLLDEPHEADRMRDPRVTALVATDDAGTVLGALAWYAVHPNALGQSWPHFGSDLFGVARDEAERRLGPVRVGFGGGSSGDISPRPVDLTGHARDGEIGASRPDRCEQIGSEIGRVVADLVPGVTTGPFTLGARHEIWSPESEGLPAPLLGMAMAGGGVDGPSSMELWRAVSDGVRSPRYRRRRDRAHPAADGQGPKINVLAAFLPVPVELRWLFRFLLPSEVPLHVVRVGDHAFATVPGEPTTMAGWRIEQRVRRAAGTASASVIGFAGDYAGYWVTAEEYLEQRYEAASTLFGRDATAALTERLAGLASGVGD